MCLYVREPAAAAIVPFLLLHTHRLKLVRIVGITGDTNEISRLSSDLFLLVIFIWDASGKLLIIFFPRLFHHVVSATNNSKEERKKTTIKMAQRHIFFFSFCQIKLEYQRDEWNRWKWRQRQTNEPFLLDFIVYLYIYLFFFIEMLSWLHLNFCRGESHVYVASKTVLD